MSLRQRALGANKEQMALQHDLYSQHVKKNIAEGRMGAKREGILIFDEVKVKGKSYGIQKIIKFSVWQCPPMNFPHHITSFQSWMNWRKFRKLAIFCSSSGDTSH